MADYLFFLKDPLIFHSIIMLLSLYIIFKAADLLVTGASEYAKKLGLSDSLIGLIVISIAASTPEMINALIGLFKNDTGILLGTIIGANMIHLTIAIGLLILLGTRIELKCELLEKIHTKLWIMLAAPFLMAINGVISRTDGIILIACYIWYMITIWKKEGTIGQIKKQVKFKKLWKDMFIFAGALFAIILAGSWLVGSAIRISGELGIPTFLIAITIIGLGGTLPDFVIELKSIRKGHSQIGVGDALGSVILELLLFLGIVSIIKPIPIDFATVGGAMIFLLTSVMFMMYLVKKSKVTKIHGIALIAIYTIFLAYEIIRAI